MAQDKLFGTLSTRTSVDPLFESISAEKMATAHFHNSSYINIRSSLNKRVVIPFGGKENGISFCQVTHDQTVIFHIEIKTCPSPPPYREVNRTLW